MRYACGKSTSDVAYTLLELLTDKGIGTMAEGLLAMPATFNESKLGCFVVKLAENE